MSSGSNPKTPNDRRQWRNCSAEERLVYASKLIVLHPRFREAVALLEHCHTASKHGSEPICGALLGASGVGKTSVVDHYRRLHPTVETETATCQPVLKVTLQPDARPKGIAADLLLALGDPAWAAGTVQTLDQSGGQAAAALRRGADRHGRVPSPVRHGPGQGDDQGLAVAQGAHRQHRHSRWSSAACRKPNTSSAPSTPNAASSSGSRCGVSPGAPRKASGNSAACSRSSTTRCRWPSPPDCPNPRMAGRFYLACRGVPDYLMTLVRGAVAEAIGRKNERILMDDLARVYERCLAHQRVLAEQANPFIGDLDKAALDRVQPADQARTAGIGLSPRAARAKRKPTTAANYLGGRQ